MELIDGLFDGKTHRLMREDGRYLINTEDFIQQGFDLEERILQGIYGGNFRRFVGGDPRPVHPWLVRRECRRIRLMLKIMGFIDKNLKADPTVSQNASAFFRKNR
jgi:hypothetical protein